MLATLSAADEPERPIPEPVIWSAPHYDPWTGQWQQLGYSTGANVEWCGTAGMVWTIPGGTITGWPR